MRTRATVRQRQRVEQRRGWPYARCQDEVSKPQRLGGTLASPNRARGWAGGAHEDSPVRGVPLRRGGRRAGKASAHLVRARERSSRTSKVDMTAHRMHILPPSASEGFPSAATGRCTLSKLDWGHSRLCASAQNCGFSKRSGSTSVRDSRWRAPLENLNENYAYKWSPPASVMDT